MLRQLLNIENREDMVYIGISILIILFGKSIVPQLPSVLKNLLNCNIGRTVILAIISYVSTINFQSAIVISLGFIIIMSSLEVKEHYFGEGWVKSAFNVTQQILDGARETIVGADEEEDE